MRLRLDATGKPSFVRWVVSDLPFDGGWIGPDQLGDYFSARSVANAMRSVMLPAPYPILRSPNKGYARRHEDLLGLARGGVYHAPIVTNRAVRSYRTLSPFPVPSWKRAGSPFYLAIGGLLSVALSLVPSRPIGLAISRVLERVGVTHRRVLSCSDFPPMDEIHS